MAEDFEKILKLKVEAIFKRAELFSNLELPTIPEMVQTVKEVGIPESEFKRNNNSTAPFNFLAQFGALVHESNEFNNYFEYDDPTNSSLKVCRNHIFWLAACLFKLNLHMAADPFALYERKDQKQAHMVNSMILGAMEVPQEVFTPMVEAFKLLRELSYRSYVAYLEDEEPPQVNIESVSKIIEKFESVGNAGKYIGLATFIAYGYTNALFSVGITKDLTESVKVNFTVEKSQQGYQKATVIHAFHNRFSKYAASYANWYEMDNLGNIGLVSDVGDFNTQKQVLFEIDKQFVYVALPETATLSYVLENSLEFAQSVSKNKLDRKVLISIFPIF